MGNDAQIVQINDERIDVREDGRIILYKRDGLKNPKWQARLKIPNATGYKIVSTKTKNRREAENFAINLYDELAHHVRLGGSIKSITFQKVFDEWEKFTSVGRTNKDGKPWNATIERVRSYALKFFGSKKIDDIEAKDFQLYWHWRRANYSKRSPSNGTLGRERTAILAVFKFAAQMGHISNIPDSMPPKSSSERRPTFTEIEWKTVLAKSEEWLQEGMKKSVGRDRFLALNYFLVLVNTGLRVGEIRKLKWGDLRPLRTEDGNFVIAEVRGKTGSREVVCQPKTGHLFNKIINMRMVELKKQFPDEPKKWKPTYGQLVFCHPDGTKIQTFKKSFHSLLKFANIPIEKNGSSRTIYSLRHLYATQRLYEDVSPFLLAKQMGTSVEMLEKHYGQTVTSHAAAQITKTRKQKKPTKDTAAQTFEV